MKETNVFSRTTQYPQTFLTPQDKAMTRRFGDEDDESELSPDMQTALLKVRKEIHDPLSELVMEEYFLEEDKINPNNAFPLEKCRFYILKLRDVMVGALDVCYDDRIFIPNIHIHTAFHRLGIGTFLYTQLNEYIFNQEDTKGRLLQSAGLETEAGEALGYSLIRKGLAESSCEETIWWVMKPPMTNNKG